MWIILFRLFFSTLPPLGNPDRAAANVFAGSGIST